MIGGHRVTKQDQHPRAGYIADRRRRHGHVLEIRRILDIGRVRFPLVEFSLGNLQTIPVFVAIEYLCVLMREHFTINAGIHRFVNFLQAGPDVPQIHGLAIGIFSQRAVDQVDMHIAGQRIGHHQRW